MSITPIKVRVVKRPIIKARFVPQLPANLTGRTAIAVERNGSIYYLDLDYAKLFETTVFDPASTVIAILNADGTWNKTTIASLSTMIGADKPNLVAIANAATAADKLGYWSGEAQYSLTDFTAYMRTLLDDPDATTARATLGLVIGTDVQPHDAELDALAGLVSAADRLPYFTGPGTAALTVLTPFARTLLDDADAATMRATIDAQQHDTDLDAIAALTPTNDDFIQRKAGAWVNRSIAQVKADLAINNVDNTSDLNKPISTATQSALNAKANSADLSTVATTGAYGDLSGKPVLGTAAATNATDYATAAQGAKADSALQSVVAGANVTVDNTDPRNPVVSATGGGGGGSGDMLASVYDPTGVAGDAFDIRKMRGFSQVTKPVVFDMHWRALRGVPWAATEAGGVVSYTVAASAAKGATSLTLSGASLPVDQQLIVVLGDDGEYYSASVGAMAGSTASLAAALPVAVSAGATCWNFYINESHPNEYGYRAIADELVRKPLRNERELFRGLQPAVVGSATVAPYTSANAHNPGSANVPAYLVTPSAINGGCAWTFNISAPGPYKARFKVNTAGASDLHIRIFLNGNSIYDFGIPNAADGYPNEVMFEASDPGSVEVRLYRASTTAIFITSYMSVLSVGDGIEGFETGRHVLFGDSWFAVASDLGVGDFGIIDRLRERFPRATWINKGVGGNDGAALVARFLSDVPPENPDFVHIVGAGGTNGYYGGNTPLTEGNWLGWIRSQVLALGAVPIAYTSSVGAVSSPTRFDLSRQYAANIRWWDYAEAGGTTSGSNANGTWVKWANGIIEQWGAKATNGTGDATVTFPIPFTTLHHVGVNVRDAPIAAHIIVGQAYNTTASGCAIRAVDAASGAVSGVSVNTTWYAKGV